MSRSTIQQPSIMPEQSRQYEQFMLDIEREVMGSDYGATSYTTRTEAQGIGQLLRLRPGIRLLDVGAGTG